MKLKILLLVTLLAVLLLTFSVVSSAPAQQSNGIAALNFINGELAARGANRRAVQIEYFTIGEGRPADRILQQEFAWVPNDPRRLAQGTNLTYIVDQSGGSTLSGLSNADTEAAIDRAMQTWNGEQCLRRVGIVKRADPGSDITIFDAFFGYGGFGDYTQADIVNAGWFPRDYFEAVGGPGGGRGILAFSVTFTFVDDAGNPTDINNDRRADTALNEVYYNNTFGDPGNDRAGNPWAINGALPAIDVQTVAFHENGHSLGLGHFGPPPSAVMNPIYAGIQHSASATDRAGMCANYASWPNR